MEKKISIIIPVYNGQDHISSCINNIMLQNYKNFEIIIINDGSIDNTANILDQFSEEERVKIINKKNTGVSDSRNLGIIESTGEFIMFVDSDDNLDPETLTCLNKQLEDDNSIDMILYGFSVEGSDNRFNDTKVLQKIVEESCQKEVVIRKILSTKDNIYGYIWRAIYSKELLEKNNIRFPLNIKISEDYMFLLDAVRCSSNIKVDCNEYYKYIINTNSMTTKYIPSLLEDMMNVNKWVYENIINEELDKYYYCNLCNTYLRFVQNTARNKDYNFFEIMKKIKIAKKEYKFQYALRKNTFKINLFTNKTYISIMMFRFHFEFIYILLFLIKEKGIRRRK